jgi:small nuclear ribonucleoprotein (snRNP)-like protein
MKWPGDRDSDFAGNGGRKLVQPLEFVKRNPGPAGSCHVGSVLGSFRGKEWCFMEPSDLTPFLESLLGKIVVVDFKSTYVCLGTLVGCDSQFLELRDADLHDFRDSPASREVYVHDSIRLGIRRNRSRVLIRREDVVALTRFDEISTF